MRRHDSERNRKDGDPALSQESYIREVRITTTWLCISYKDDVAVSDLNSTYFHILSGIRDFLDDSAAGPVAYEYIQGVAAPLNSAQTHPNDINM